MLKFDRQELIPAVIQDDVTDEVLMVAFMNQEALRLTRETGYAHFFSRSRAKIWRKGEQSGNVQEVRSIFVNCEENSILVRVVQHGVAACHDGYHSCYYRQLLPDDTYQVVAEQVFDPEVVYHHTAGDEALHIVKASRAEALSQRLDKELRQLYGAYIYLRDHDLSEESNTSRLLQEHSQSYLASRLADELQELADVQSGLHVHKDRQFDTILEGSQVGYWLFLLAASRKLSYDDFLPHISLLHGYNDHYTEAKVIEQRQDCLNLLATDELQAAVQGLQLGFTLVGWACAQAMVSPLASAEFDLDQMRRKGLVQ